ncbi:MAG TPA: helix-turn-helix transcriptional regulator [Victivallales bacterium]|nr:helix-turn-helix transcriptional regulator [Victivallales bacterium]
MKSRLKQIRESLKLSQKAMAEKIGIGVRNWQGYESGENIPGGKVLQSLAKLGFNINWILTGEGSMYSTKDPSESIFWNHKPDSSRNTLELFEKLLKENIEKIILIKYYDHLFGNPQGFIIIKENDFITISGGGTRSGYSGGGVTTYCRILEMIKEKNISVGIVELDEHESYKLNEFKVEDILKKAKFFKEAIDYELSRVRPPNINKDMPSENKQEKTIGNEINLDKLIRELIFIMDSDDEGTKIAITQNIMMFAESVRRKKLLENAAFDSKEELKKAAG